MIKDFQLNLFKDYIKEKVKNIMIEKVKYYDDNIRDNIRDHYRF